MKKTNHCFCNDFSLTFIRFTIRSMNHQWKWHPGPCRILMGPLNPWNGRPKDVPWLDLLESWLFHRYLVGLWHVWLPPWCWGCQKVCPPVPACGAVKGRAGSPLRRSQVYGDRRPPESVDDVVSSMEDRVVLHNGWFACWHSQQIQCYYGRVDKLKISCFQEVSEWSFE